MGKLYKPQPSTFRDFLNQQYMIFGIFAMLFITFLTVFSTQRAIKWTGYEFFKLTHWVVAILYVGACWGHWKQLYCWMVPSLALIVIDQAIRGLRILALHYRGGQGEPRGFKSAQATLQLLETTSTDQILRLDFDYPHRTPWSPGQHFYLTFPSLSLWQAHSYTPSSLPSPSPRISQHHTYIIRARSGQSAQLVALARSGTTSLPVILTGPYGNAHPQHQTDNLLAVAGGTGVSFTYPIALACLRQMIVPQAFVEFVWIIRRAEDLLWLKEEMVLLREMLTKTACLRVKVFVTREARLEGLAPGSSGSSSSETGSQSDGSSGVVDFEKLGVGARAREVGERGLSRQGVLDLFFGNAAADKKGDGCFKVEFLAGAHPDLGQVVEGFMERVGERGGCVEVVGSGPEALGSRLREAVAGVQTQESLGFYWDSRG